MNRSASKLGVLVVFVLLLSAVGSWAQSSGAITGTLVDPRGALVAGASVQAFDEEKGVVVRTTTSGADGLFQLQPLQPGKYSVRVKASGMKEMERRNLVLDSRQVLGLGELQLQLGSVNETMTVEAKTPLVETANSDHSAVVDAKLVAETSLNGRDFQSLVKTLPGVVSNDASDFRLAFNNTDAFHVNGMRGSDNNFYLDGAINTDVGANDGQFTQLSMDAVGEFKLQSSNFAAEYGRNPGVLMAVNTKGGTRQFHGTLYEFHREDSFDATPFGQSSTNFLRFNQYGGNIGGPIPIPHAKDKLFFFFNYEGTRGERPGNTQFNSQVRPGLGRGYTLPDPKWLQGDFTSAYSGGQLGHSPFENGQIFVPGSITYAPDGQVLNGTPICGTVASPCNVVPQSLFSSQAQAFIKYWTQAYGAGGIPDPSSINPAGLASRVFIPFNETYVFRKHQEVIRIDYNINAKTNFFFRWVDDSQQEQFHNLFDFADYPILPEYRKKPGSSWSWNLVNVITPTMTNEFIFSYNHLTQLVDIVPGTPKATFDRTALGFNFSELFPNSNLDNRAPVLTPCCNGTFTGGSFHPGWHSEARMFTWTDNLAKVFGPHTFKTGVFFDYNQAGQQPVWQDTTFLDFSTGASNAFDSGNYVSNVLLGNFLSAQQSNGVFFGAFRFHQVEAYAQDSWKVNRKLTLDYGLRWAYLGPTYTVQPFFQNYFDPARYNPANAVTLNTVPGLYFGDICSAALANPAPGSPIPAGQCPGVTNFGDPFNGIVQEGKGIPPGLAKHRYNNIAPRFGFAWDPKGDGKTAIRGGAGIFYERIRQNVNSFDGLGNPPLSYTPTIFNQNIDNLGPQLVTGVRAPVALNAFDPEGQIPTTYSWSLGVQRELPWSLALDVSYVGNQARHLQYQYDLQSLPVGSVLDTAGLTQPFFAPYKGYTNIRFTKYDANSSYNALQAKVTRRFGKGLFLTADYTYSRAIDLNDCDNIGGGTGCSNTQITDPFNVKRDYAVAGYDRTHVFSANYVYSLPNFRINGVLKYITNGWQVSGITRFWSGPPIDIFINGGNAGNFVNVVRPDFNGGQVYTSHDDNVHWFNPFVFTAPQPGSVGNLPRNRFRGPGINNWDISLFKNFNFSESRYLQLRLETFNTFNHTQPAAIGNDHNAPNNWLISTPGPGLAPTPATVGNAGNVTGYRDPRNVQLGVKLYF
jgi:Carboxypeptidase regulatory-like domain/TonB-dependent Receptor Plug Domain